MRSQNFLGGIFINLLILTAFFAPAWAYGGPPKQLYDLSKKLVQRGHDVTVFTTNAFEANKTIHKRCDIIDGVKVYYLRNLSNWLAWNQKIFLPLGLRRLLSCEIRNFDCVFFQGFRNYLNLLGYRYAMKYKVPYVIFAYGQLPRVSGIKGAVKYVLDLYFCREMLQNASKLIAQNLHEKEEYLRLGAPYEKIKVVPLGVDLNEFQNLPEKGRLRKKIGIKNDEKVVLFLGRINEFKGLDLLLRTLSELKKKQNFKFVIVGRDDGYLSSMKNLIASLGMSNRAIFVGPLYGKDRLAAYVDADVFVLSASIYEETPVAALEACAAYRPVIVTKQASIPWLEEYQAGITVDYSLYALKDALDTLLEDNNLRKTFGNNARKMIEEKFDWAKIIDVLEKSLEDIKKLPESARTASFDKVDPEELELTEAREATMRKIIHSIFKEPRPFFFVKSAMNFLSGDGWVRK